MCFYGYPNKFPLLISWLKTQFNQLFNAKWIGFFAINHKCIMLTVSLSNLSLGLMIHIFHYCQFQLEQ